MSTQIRRQRYYAQALRISFKHDDIDAEQPQPAASVAFPRDIFPREKTRSLSHYPRTRSLPRPESTRSIKHTGYGGFPTPLEMLKTIAYRLAPEKSAKLGRTLTQEPTTAQTNDELTGLRVGRNSRFLKLTQEQKEELGGIEYRASRLLLVIVCCVSLRPILV